MLVGMRSSCLSLGIVDVLSAQKQNPGTACAKENKTQEGRVSCCPVFGVHAGRGLSL